MAADVVCKDTSKLGMCLSIQLNLSFEQYLLSLFFFFSPLLSILGYVPTKIEFVLHQTLPISLRKNGISNKEGNEKTKSKRERKEEKNPLYKNKKLTI